MRRRLLTLAIALGVALAMSIPVGAAELHDDHQGTECDGFTSLHFVNNQIRGNNDVFLWLIFDTGTVFVGSPHKSNGGTNHWTVAATSSDVLINAFTTTKADAAPMSVTYAGPGKLVLSDYKCKAPPKKA